MGRIEGDIMAKSKEYNLSFEDLEIVIDELYSRLSIKQKIEYYEDTGSDSVTDIITHNFNEELLK